MQANERKSLRKLWRAWGEILEASVSGWDDDLHRLRRRCREMKVWAPHWSIRCALEGLAQARMHAIRDRLSGRIESALLMEAEADELERHILEILPHARLASGGLCLA